MKRKLQLIALTVLLPIIAVCALGYVTLRQDKPNGFIRKFREGYAQKVAETKYNFNLYDICGTTSSAVYFRTDDPNWVYAYDYSLASPKIVNTHVGEDPRIKQFFKTTIDSQSFTVYAGNIPAIIKGNITDNNVPRSLSLPHTLFNDIVEYSPGRYIVRRYDEQHKDFVFQKMDSTGKILATEKNVSIKTPEVGIASQGTMLYGSASGKIYYIYRLFNKIVCFDTSLQHFYTTITVDTISKPTIEISKVTKKTSKFTTYGSTPKYTNYKASLSEDFLYVYSLIRSDNDLQAHLPVLDVYSLDNGMYQFSFHLPDAPGNIDEFAVHSGILTAVFSKQQVIVNYKINTK